MATHLRHRIFPVHVLIDLLPSTIGGFQQAGSEIAQRVIRRRISTRLRLPHDLNHCDNDKHRDEEERQK